jgi:nicotinamidase-related amidase
MDDTSNDLPVSSVVLDAPPIVPANTALVVVDMTRGFVVRGEGRLRFLEESGGDFSYFEERVRDTVVPNLQRLLSAVRRSGGKVIFLRAGAARDDFADAGIYARSLRAFGCRDGLPGSEVIPELAPEPDDISLLKRASGGFTQSGLDGHLRNLGVEHVLYTGVLTNACVYLTAVAGTDLGYHGTLVADCTATHSDRVQTMAQELISLYVRVAPTSDVLAEFGAEERVETPA